MRKEFVEDIIDFKKIKKSSYSSWINDSGELENWKFLFDFDAETRNAYAQIKKYIIGKKLKKIADDGHDIKILITAIVFLVLLFSFFKLIMVRKEALDEEIIWAYATSSALIIIFFISLYICVCYFCINWKSKERKIKEKEIMRILFPDLEIVYMNRLLRHKFLYKETYSLIEQDGTYHLSDEDEWIEKDENFFVKDSAGKKINEYKAFEIEKVEGADSADHIAVNVYCIYVKE